MSVTIAEKDGMKRQAKILLSANQLEEAYQARLKEVCKKAKIDGFRPGKVPASVVEMRFGKGLLEEAAMKLAYDAFDEQVKSMKLDIIGQPRVTSHEIKRQSESAYEIEFELYPVFDLVTLNDVELEVPVAEVSDADLEVTLNDMRQQVGEWVVVDRASQDGDQITIDFEGYVDGEVFSGGEAKGFKLQLGSGQMIPGFEDGLIGVKLGESREINVTFPEEYHAENLKGKAALFKTTTHEVSELKLPELDDALAEKFGVKSGINALKTETRESMQRQLDMALEQKTKEVVFDKLIELNHEIVAPEIMVEQEIDGMIEKMKEDLKSRRGMKKIPDHAFPRDMFVEQAKKRVLLGLLVSEVVQKNEIKLDEDRVSKYIEVLAASYDDKDQAINWYRSNEQMMMQVRATVMEQQVVEFLTLEATLKSKKYAYEALIKEAHEGV